MNSPRKLPVVQVLVGLQRVGLAGFWEALEEAERSDLADREETTAFILERLRERNYIPESYRELYERAVWREVLRRRGEDYRPFLSELEVTVQAEPGKELDVFLADLEAVFAEHDLRPRVSLEEAEAGNVTPRLVIDGAAVIEGKAGRRALQNAVRRQISDW